MRALGAVLLVFVACVAAGCSSSGESTAAASTSTSGAAPVAEAAGGPLLVVDRSGGFEGRKDHLVIRADGTGTNVNRKGKRFTLTAAQTRAVRAALKASDFAHLQDSTPPIGSGSSDSYTAVLKSGGHTVKVVEGIQELPAPLQRLWLAIDKLLYPLR
jgi:hypothetical protein